MDIYLLKEKEQSYDPGWQLMFGLDAGTTVGLCRVGIRASFKESLLFSGSLLSWAK